MGDEITPTPPSPQPFNWGIWIGGFFLTLLVGGIGNFIAGAMAMDLHSHELGFLLGAAPGILLVIIGLMFRRSTVAFGTGICTGACVMLLIGGLCGWNMVGTTFH